MYSVKINVVGCDEHILPPAAHALLHRWAVVDADYPNVIAVQKAVLMKEGETRLFVVYVSSVDDVSELKRLNVTYPRYLILALVDAINDPSLVMKCMRAGALQVVHFPVLPEDLQEALDCIAAKHQGLSTVAKLFTVTGATGGCGGTTVAINLAYELARRTKSQCVLMELALHKGVLANILGIAPRYTTSDLITDIRRVDSYVLQGALTEIADDLSVLVGPFETIQTENADPENTMQLVHLTRHLASWVVLDVPSTYDDLFFRCLMAADQNVLVTDQTVAGIRGVQMLCASLGDRHPLVVINNYDPHDGLTVDRIKGFVKGCEILTIAAHPSVGASMNNGQPLRLHSPRSPVLADIDAVLRNLEPDATDSSSDKKESMLMRLGHALNLS